MKVSELRESTIDELSLKEQDMRKELFNLRFQQATGEIENPMRIRSIRKDIARVLTVITEKKKQSK
ncbi:MAG: 50S ribosomal protein L29 [Nitrospiraceae bacterium]|nr:50S ribosomal protein L29 [Nitrospiraceae bacterium]MDA8432497.1 50S ribosomal protein L29 [Nitrospiraceae bacterium]